MMFIEDLTPAQEKIATNYALEQFKDCKTLQDFQDKLKEIEFIAIIHINS